MRGYFSAGVIPDETKALSLLAPANAVAGLLPGGGLLPTPNPLSQVGFPVRLKSGETIRCTLLDPNLLSVVFFRIYRLMC